VRSAKCHGNPKPQARHQQARLDHGTELIKAWPVSSTCSLFPTTQRLGRQLSATGQRVRTSAAHSQHSVVNLHVSRIPQVAPVRIPRPSVPEECVRTRLTTLPGTNQRVVCNAANGHGPMASGVPGAQREAYLASDPFQAWASLRRYRHMPSPEVIRAALPAPPAPAAARRNTF
jgi:hypothetical protein